MENTFLRFLDMSISAAAVIAVVLLLRLLLRNAPKKWRYLLWSAAGFRLACPVSFRAAFSIFRLGPKAATAPAAASAAGELRYIPRPAVSAAPVITNPITVTGTPVPVQSGAITVQAAAPAVSPMQLLLTVGTVLWLAGIVVMLIVGVVSYLRMKDKLADAVRLEESVFASDSIRAPFILGLLPPRIFVPAGLEGKELGYVLAHERTHLRRLDHWIKLLGYLLLTLHWFNPLVWLAFCLMSRDMEMSCDEQVLTELGGEAKNYSRTLLSFAEGRRFPAPAPLGFGESDVKCRIKNALRWRKPKLWVTVLAVVLCLAAIAACTANPKEKTEESTAPGVDLMASDIHEARLLNSSRDQVYGLNKDQRDELIRLLSAVPADKIVQGRGIPSEKVLEMTGADYSLRFAGGVIELDFHDPAAAAKKYGPAVWEIRDEALYDWLEALWTENSAVLEPEQGPEPRFVIPDVEADTNDDTVFFGFAEGRLALLGVEGKTNQDVIDAVPFDNLSFRREDNFLEPEDPSILSGGALRSGMSVTETRLALFGYTYHSDIGEQQMRKPRIVLHPEVGADDYPISGIYAGQLFDLSLLYGSGGEVLADVTLAFLPNEGEDHALELYALVRSALTRQLGLPQTEELNGHYDREETSYDRDGNAISSSEPVDYVMAAWWDEDATLTLRLEIGQYYSRSLTIDFYENIYYLDGPETPEDPLPAMAALKAEDIIVQSFGCSLPDAEALAAAMNASAAHPVYAPLPEESKYLYWHMEAFYHNQAMPFDYSTLIRHFALQAGLAEDLVYVTYYPGGAAAPSSVWVEDHDLYALVRGSYRQEPVIEADAWEKYGSFLEEHAQSFIDAYAPTGACRMTAFTFTRLEKTAYVMDNGSGEIVPIYLYDVAYTPEDVRHVGLSGGMGMDAELRVTGLNYGDVLGVGGAEGAVFFCENPKGGGDFNTLPGRGSAAKSQENTLWKEAYWELIVGEILPNTEYLGAVSGPVTDLALATLRGGPVPELICYLPGAGMSAAAAVFTFEEGEVRAFNAECSFGLPLAKNAVEACFWANPQIPAAWTAALRFDEAQNFWVLNSANGSSRDYWCRWFRFGADRCGYLACEQLIDMELELDDQEREIGWKINGEDVTKEEYRVCEAEYSDWLESLNELEYPPIGVISLRDRDDGLLDRLADWLGYEP